MDGGFGPLLLIALVVLVGVVGVLSLIALVAFVMLGGVGVLALKGRTESARQQANEAKSEEDW